MSFKALLNLRRGLRAIKNQKLVQDWWPKPTIRVMPIKYWGDRWTNGGGHLHKYECRSFSSVGFHTSKPQVEGLPGNLCFAYGETPEQAYDRWCGLFDIWNKKEEWTE